MVKGRTVASTKASAGGVWSVCMYSGKKQNCPIDDEGLRFYYSENEKKSKATAPLPKKRTPASDEHQNVNFCLDIVGVTTYASKTFSLGVER